MGSTADKASGLANEAIGKAKQGVGKVVGSDKLKAEGAAQELKGDAQRAVGGESGNKGRREQDSRRGEQEALMVATGGRVQLARLLDSRDGIDDETN
jgi:uncharacterized protein YjbJ (UPF0337 family)